MVTCGEGVRWQGKGKSSICGTGFYSAVILTASVTSQIFRLLLHCGVCPVFAFSSEDGWSQIGIQSCIDPNVRSGDMKQNSCRECRDTYIHTHIHMYMSVCMSDLQHVSSFSQMIHYHAHADLPAVKPLICCLFNWPRWFSVPGPDAWLTPSRHQGCGKGKDESFPSLGKEPEPESPFLWKCSDISGSRAWRIPAGIRVWESNLNILISAFCLLGCWI